MEENTNKREVEAGAHRRESKIIFLIGCVIALVLAISLIVSLILLFFPVVEIEVVGESRYSYAEIIEATGVKVCGRLYYLNESKAERKALEKLTYLEDVEVNSYFPNRVKIEIKEFDDVYLVEHERGYCYVNGGFEILEIIESAASYEKFMGKFVRLEQKLTGEVGSTYEGEDAARAAELAEYLKVYGFYQYLNVLDVSQKYNISFVVEKRYKFVIGSMTDVEEKIDVSFKVCFTDNFKREENCIIDSSDKKRVVLRYVTDEMISEEFDFCEN